MAGAYSAQFAKIIQDVVSNATGATVDGLTASTWHIILTHTTLTDAYLITDTGRMAGANSTDFQQQLVSSTATWTLASSTSPSRFENKVDIVISTGNFAAPAETTIKGWFAASTNSTAAGVIYGWGDVTPNQVVSTGNTVQFSTGDLTFDLGGGAST